MHNYTLASTIFSSQFFAEKSWMEKMISFNLAGILDTASYSTANLEHITAQNREETAMMMFALKDDGSFGHAPTEAEQTTKNIIVHTINGPMMQDTICGVAGTDEIGYNILAGNNDPSVISHLFKIKTPGGQVVGTFELANIMQQSTKPIVTYANGLCCSAGMPILISGDHAMLSSETCRVGSIGTRYSVMDFTEQLKASGVKQFNVVADGSEGKDASYDALLAGDPQPLKDELLNPLNKHFQQFMRDAGVKEEGLDGKSWTGSNAIKLGMADNIGTIEDALQLTFKLGENYLKNKLAA